MIGGTLKRLRGIYGYSAKEMSEILGISNSYLSEIEHGKKTPSLELIEKYAESFGLRPSTLLRFSEEYDYEEKNGRGQQFITKLMSRVIERYGAGI